MGGEPGCDYLQSDRASRSGRPYKCASEFENNFQYVAHNRASGIPARSLPNRAERVRLGKPNKRKGSHA